MAYDFLFFYTEKQLESAAAAAAKGGRGAIEFSAEIMMKRAIWQINEYFGFGIRKNGVSVAPRRFSFFDFYMRNNKVTHICGLGPMHLWPDPPRGCPRMHKIHFIQNHLACQCIHLCLANLSLRFS